MGPLSLSSPLSVLTHSIYALHALRAAVVASPAVFPVKSQPHTLPPATLLAVGAPLVTVSAVVWVARQVHALLLAASVLVVLVLVVLVVVVLVALAFTVILCTLIGPSFVGKESAQWHWKRVVGRSSLLHFIFLRRGVVEAMNGFREEGDGQSQRDSENEECLQTCHGVWMKVVVNVLVVLVVWFWWSFEGFLFIGWLWRELTFLEAISWQSRKCKCNREIFLRKLSTFYDPWLIEEALIIIEQL